MRINNGMWGNINPCIPPWDSSEEKVIILLREGLDPGHNTVYLKFRNCMDLSVQDSIDVVYVGLKYYITLAEAQEGEIILKWTTASEVFGADFEIYRECPQEGAGSVLVQTVDGDCVDLAGLKHNAYKWVDRDIVAGRQYCYRIRGSFDMYVEGRLTTFEAVSKDITVTSVIPTVDGLVSNLMPNPFGEGGTSFSIDVPRTVFDPSDPASSSRGILRSPALGDLKTPLSIRVFNIRGELVRDLYSMSIFGGYRTFDWDGRDDRGNPAAPGVYFIRVDAGGARSVRKAVLIR